MSNPETLLDEMLGTLTSATKGVAVELAPISANGTCTVDNLVKNNIAHLLCQKELSVEQVNLLTALLQWRS